MSFALLSLDLAFISDREVQNKEQTAVAFSTMLLLGISIFGLSAFILFGFQVLNLIKIEKHFIVYIFLAGICLELERVLYSLFREKKEFSHVAKARVIITISHPVAGCFLAFFMKNAYVLLIAFALSHLIGAFYYLKIAKQKGILPVWIFDIRRSKDFLVNNLNTVIFQTPSGLFRTIYGNLPVLLIRKVFSTDVLGFYSLSMRVLGTTNRLMSQGLYETFLPYVAKSERNRESALRYFPIICSIFFLPFFAASFLSSWYVRLLFGESYLFVSEIIKIMGPFYFTQAAVGPYLGFILIYRRSELNLTINLLGIALQTGLFYLGRMFLGLSGAIFSICIGGIIVEQSLLMIATSLSGQSVRKVCLSLLPYQLILFAVPMGLVSLSLAPVLLIPSLYVVFKNREILFRKHKQMPPSGKTTD